MGTKPFRIITLILLLTSIRFTLVQSQYLLEWSKEEPSKLSSTTRDCASGRSHECHKIRLDSENNVIVGGTSFENGSLDLLIVKYSNDGELIWKHLIDVANKSIDHLMGMTVDEEDNIIAIGYSSQDSFATSVVLKFNSTGDIIWENSFSGNSGWSFPYSFTLDTNGNVFMIGYVNKDFFSTEMFVAKFDNNGNYKWDDLYSVDSTGKYEGTAIRIIDDVVIALGNFWGSNPRNIRAVILKYSKNGELLGSSETSYEGSFSSSHIDKYGNSYFGLIKNFRLLKFDVIGNLEWSFEVPKHLPDNWIADVLEDITSDAEGNIYITGRHYGENYGDTLKFTNGDLPVVKISSDGDPIYDYLYQNQGINAFDGGEKLFLGKDDYMVVGGSTEMKVGTNYDYLAIVLDELGEAIDTLIYHKEGNEVIKSVIMDDSLNIYVTGTGNGNTLTQKYSFSGNIDVGIEEDGNENKEIRITPNPFREKCIIEFSEQEEIVEFRLFDSTGGLVMSFKKNNVTHIVIDGHFLPGGVYYYHIFSGEYSLLGNLINLN